MGGDPFGMGGGGGGGKPPDTTGLYKTLGVQKNAQPDEIKKASRKLAMELHPDKGGDLEKFKEVQKAFDVLGDEKKRTSYDDYGEEGLEKGGGGGPTDIFDMFGGGRSRRSQNSGIKKGEATTHPLKVTLEQIMKGGVRTLKVTRRVIDSSSVNHCGKCDGHGVVVQTIRMGPPYGLFV